MSAVRVGLECTALELDAAGTARALRGLRGALAAREDVEVVELAHPRDGRGRIARGLDRELRWWPRGLGRAARECGVDVVHCPVAPGVTRTPGRPLVVTVNDVLPLDHPAWFTRANVLQHRVALRGVLRRAACVATPSAATARSLRERFGVEADVVPYGVEPRFTPGEPDAAVLRELGVTPPYVVTVATLQPRKNLGVVLAAWPRLAAPHRLVVVGARGWGDVEVAGKRVVPVGRVDDGALVALLRGADALVHPSRHEGFGFPPLEAMACGTPVVAAQAASVPEVVGDAGVLVDASDPRALAGALDDLLADGARRAELRERGLRRAREYTWARCADAMVGLYRRALDD